MQADGIDHNDRPAGIFLTSPTSVARCNFMTGDDRRFGKPDDRLFQNVKIEPHHVEHGRNPYFVRFGYGVVLQHISGGFSQYLKINRVLSVLFSRIGIAGIALPIPSSTISASRCKRERRHRAAWFVDRPQRRRSSARSPTPPFMSPARQKYQHQRQKKELPTASSRSLSC